MSGKCRPSLRPKTLYNVDRSSLSTTDKECIHSVFELADHQKSEIEKNEKIIKAANDLIETQKAEIERLKKELNTDFVFLGRTGKTQMSSQLIRVRVDAIRAQGIIEGMQKAMDLIADGLKRKGG